MLSPAPSPYKPTHVPDGRFALPAWSVLRVEGPDAGAFLQAQTMNDVAALQPGRWQWNGWLNPKGRLHALFALLRMDESAFLLALPDMPAAELGTALQRYVFRSKLRLEAGDAWQVHGEFAPAPGSSGADVATATPEGGWILDMGSATIGRRLHLSRATGTAIGETDAAVAPGADADAWMEQDLRHGLPHLSAPQREAWTPQMLSLQRLRAYSLSKGCYPGQEIVARTHYLGHAKRSLRLLSGDGLVAGGDVVLADTGQAVGSIVCVHSHSRLALAVLGDFNHAAALQSADHPVQQVALADGLQRPL